MVDETDRTIVDAGLRELTEETGIEGDQVKIIGILRMDWAFVHSITGVSVTPIIGYLGNFEELKVCRV
jgi:8-oxo-dGTP pyrophosphatase MutT (NUDIX family)